MDMYVCLSVWVYGVFKRSGSYRGLCLVRVSVQQLAVHINA